MSETHRVAPMKHSKEIKYPMASSLERRANVQVACLNTSTRGKGSAVLSSFGNPPAGAVGGPCGRERVAADAPEEDGAPAAGLLAGASGLASCETCPQEAAGERRIFMAWDG